MISNLVALPDLVIPSGSNVSNVLNGKLTYADAIIISIYSPATLDAHTFQIKVSYDDTAVVYAAGTFRVLEIGDPAADATPPTAGRARSYFELPGYAAFCIFDASGNVAADRTFKAFKLWGGR